MATEQLTLGQQARDEALERVREHANPTWLDFALLAVAQLADTRLEFTSDDVWARLAGWKLDHLQHEPRALGAVLHKANLLGWIAPTSTYQPTRRPSRHYAPIRVWRSLKYRED